MENARSPHDPSYKQFFSNPDMVASLLRDLVPEDFVNDLDFSTLEQCSGSYVTDYHAPATSNKVLLFYNFK